MTKDDLITIAHNRSINAFKHFLELLGLEPNLFNHLFEINVESTDEAVGLGCAYLFPGDNHDNEKIYLLNEYLDYFINKLENGEKTRQEIIDEVSTSILHEMLHANRAILISGKVPSDYISLKDSIEEADRFFDKAKYVELLDNSISSGYFNYFDKFIPLTVKEVSDSHYDVVVYDKENDLFCFYDNQEFSYPFGNNITLLAIGLELNTKSIIHNISFSLPASNLETDTIYDASSYFHQNENDLSINDKEEVLNNQNQLEEFIVEYFAKLIMNCRKSKNIDFDFLSSDGDFDYDSNEMLVANFFKNGKEELAKWFILSCYEDEYDDKLFKEFKNKYYELLSKISNTRSGYLDLLDVDIDDPTYDKLNDHYKTLHDETQRFIDEHYRSK